MRWFLILMALWAALPAWAALPPCALDDEIREAAYIVQITDLSAGPVDERGYCSIDGTVARGWRSPHAAGTRVRAFFPCSQTPVAIGAEVYRDETALLAAPVLEVHIARAGGVAGFGAGLLALSGLSDAHVWQPDPICAG